MHSFWPPECECIHYLYLLLVCCLSTINTIYELMVNFPFPSCRVGANKTKPNKLATLRMDCRTRCDGVFPQGEQCNIVPDNVDDIVADIAQEEKEEGLALLAFLSYAKLKKHSLRTAGCVICAHSIALQMTLQRPASTPTGLPGLPAARPHVKRARGWGKGCWRPSWTWAFPAPTHKILSHVWGLVAVTKVSISRMNVAVQVEERGGGGGPWHNGMFFHF